MVCKEVQLLDKLTFETVGWSTLSDMAESHGIVSLNRVDNGYANDAT